MHRGTRYIGYFRNHVDAQARFHQVFHDQAAPSSFVARPGRCPCFCAIGAGLAGPGLAPLSVLRVTHVDDAPPIIGAGVRSRRCARLRLAPGIGACGSAFRACFCAIGAGLAGPGLAPLSVLRVTHVDDAPPIIGAGVRSRRCARLRLAPGIGACGSAFRACFCAIGAGLAGPGLAPLSVLRVTHVDDAPPIIGAGVRSRRCARLRLAPGIGACGSAFRVPPLLLRRYVIICSSSAAFIPGASQGAAPGGSGRSQVDS